jgi:hypothetical protein
MRERRRKKIETGQVISCTLNKEEQRKAFQRRFKGVSKAFQRRATCPPGHIACLKSRAVVKYGYGETKPSRCGWSMSSLARRWPNSTKRESAIVYVYPWNASTSSLLSVATFNAVDTYCEPKHTTEANCKPHPHPQRHDPEVRRFSVRTPRPTSWTQYA